MDTSNQTSARFRSATEFPQTIDNLSRPDADKLYEEMRECLIFTNRSRGQLLRRNEEHKQTTHQLKANVEHLQALINQFKLEKQQLIQNKQSIVSELEEEINSMTTHLDRLAAAFEPIAEDLKTPAQISANFWHLPKRFLNFIQTVKTIVLAWRDDDTNVLPKANPSTPKLPSPNEIESYSDRRDNPQRYTDRASINRDLLDR